MDLIYQTRAQQLYFQKLVQYLQDALEKSSFHFLVIAHGRQKPSGFLNFWILLNVYPQGQKSFKRDLIILLTLVASILFYRNCMAQPFDHTDLELVSLLKQGDRIAFAYVYNKNITGLLAYVRRSISLKEDCEEIVQDVFESLWSRRETLHHVTSIRGYLFKMVKYKIVDYLRHSLVKKRYEEHYVFFAEVFENLNDSFEETSNFQVLVEKRISELPNRCQTAFRLRLHDNLPYKEIADRMKISTSTVEKHISTALQHLRNGYQNAYRPS